MEMSVLLWLSCEVCLAKSYSQEHINEHFRIRGHNTPTTSTFDARQNFKVIIFVMILPSLTLELCLMNPKLHPGIVDVELGQVLSSCVFTLHLYFRLCIWAASCYLTILLKIGTPNAQKFATTRGNWQNTLNLAILVKIGVFKNKTELDFVNFLHKN